MMKVTLVQKSVWHMAKEAMPLAAGYMAAVINADPKLSAECDVSIENFAGNATIVEMAIRLLKQPPDVVGFSVLGWNIRQFAAVAQAIKQANPHALVIFGGNHVANQAERVFKQHDAVDIVVNGEGELTFRDILYAAIDGGGFTGITGISVRDPSGGIITTPDRPRIMELDTIPSPILSGAIPLLADDGTFRYEVALIETNRGCPYHCAFCYWGGAVGQKVRAFSRDRIRRELSALSAAGAETIVLCDANFGMLPADRDFVDDLIGLMQRTGYPKELQTSWAKNKGPIFYDIVRKIRKAGLQSSFILSLQSLDSSALETMNRRNMKINKWQDLVKWLAAEGMDGYAELIWGAPGETPESFLRGYDELARHVSRIAAHPLLLLPNTEYDAQRDRYGFVAVRGEQDDFEYVLASKEVPLAENLKMQRFLFWADLVAENMLMRNTWRLLRAIGTPSQSAAILALADHIEAQDDPVARQFRAIAESAISDPDAVASALTVAFAEGRFDELVLEWSRDWLTPAVPPEWRELANEIVRYDLQIRPLPTPEKRGFGDAKLITIDGTKFWEAYREYSYDVKEVTDLARTRSLAAVPEREPVMLRLLFRDGFGTLGRSTNHEETAQYIAQVEVNPLALPARRK
jgi:radical SAM C-methyltransferase